MMLFVLVLFLISAAIQLFFQFFFIIQLNRYRPKEHILDIEDKPVSVVVCAHNELAGLKKLLAKLKIQAYRNFEVIVVDDRSDDGTYEYLRSEEEKFPALRIVRVDWSPAHVNEKKYALTLGIKSASNDLLLLTDADCEPVSINWISIMIKQFQQDTDFVLGFSYYRTYKGFLNLFIRHETLQTALLYLSAAMAGRPYMGVGRNLAYRKSFFLSKNGFNGMLKIVGGDDDLFVNRYARGRSTEVAIHPDAVVYSEPKKLFSAYLRQKIRHLAVGKKYRASHLFFLGLFSLSKMGFWVAGILLLALSSHLYWVAGGLVLIMILTTFSFYGISKKFDVKYSVGWVWLMDFVYISYLAIFSLAAFSSRKIKWN